MSERWCISLIPIDATDGMMGSDIRYPEERPAYRMSGNGPGIGMLPATRTIPASRGVPRNSHGVAEAQSYDLTQPDLRVARKVIKGG